MAGEIVLIAGDQGERSLIRAQLLEEGQRVVGLETLEEALAWLDSGESPALVIVNTRGQRLRAGWLARLEARVGRERLLVCAGPFELGDVELQGMPAKRLLVRPFTVWDVVKRAKELAQSTTEKAP